MTLTKKTGQNIIEFVFVFFVTMSIFLSIIELSLYWRAKYSIANIANEISANVQIASQNSKSANTIIEVAQNSLKKSAGLLNLESSSFSLSGSNDSYQIKSNFTKNGQSALVVFVDIRNLKNSDICTTVAYNYSGIFLFQNGKTITSSPSCSVQKF